ncbi:MAG: hypothetical protein Q8N71_03410, partial [candidate division Zixibacteria bacterium]|nr:hypothetical protein [candidate division Zixibacteria bacterium]
GIIIWQKWNKKAAKANLLSGEKQQRDSLEADEKKELRLKKRIVDQEEVMKNQPELEEADRQAKIERDLKEAELRRKIKERKEHEAGEEKPKIEENKEQDLQ